MARAAAALSLLLALTAGGTSAEAAEPDKQQSICLMIKSAAGANRIPLEFFARVIWQESRFRADAVGTGDAQRLPRAQGMAQFMPGTAGGAPACSIPFDPVQALPRDRRSSCASCAGESRQPRAGGGGLQCGAAAGAGLARRLAAACRPETRAYVSAITGTTVDEWARRRRERRAGPEAARRTGPAAS